jgi:hypothetical protein
MDCLYCIISMLVLYWAEAEAEATHKPRSGLAWLGRERSV